jgi:hypothetical protein
VEDKEKIVYAKIKVCGEESPFFYFVGTWEIFSWI